MLLLLLLAPSVSGCEIADVLDPEGDEQPLPNSQAGCLYGQFFTVEWYVDNGPGTSPLACRFVPASHVELLVNTQPEQTLSITGLCTDGSPYNFEGSSSGKIPAGTMPTSASLVSDVDGGVLSVDNIPVSEQVPIPPCQSALAPLQFSLQ